MDRAAKERKVVALIVGDLGLAGIGHKEIAEIREEVGFLSEEQLDRTLAARLDLPYPLEAEDLERVVARVQEPRQLSESG